MNSKNHSCLSRPAQHSRIIQAFESQILSARVQYFDTDYEDAADEVAQIQFSMGVSRPTVFIEVPSEIAQEFVQSSPEIRDIIFQHVIDKFTIEAQD